MKRLILAALTVAVLCTVASSQETVERTVKGQGANRQEAIKQALFEAVGQSRGVKVDSGDYSFGYQGASAGYDREGSQRTVDFDAVSVQTGAQCGASPQPSSQAPPAQRQGPSTHGLWPLEQVTSNGPRKLEAMRSRMSGCRMRSTELGEWNVTAHSVRNRKKRSGMHFVSRMLRATPTQIDNSPQ